MGLKAQELHEEYKEEYEALTEVEKAALIERFVSFNSMCLFSNGNLRYDKLKIDIPKIRRDTPKACVQDVSNTVRNIQMLVCKRLYS